MRCHSCQAQVPNDAAICPSCDAILDESFLDGADGEEEYDDEAYDDEGYDDEGLPRTATPPGVAAYDPYEPQAAEYDDDLAPAAARPESTRILQMDPERDKSTRIVQLSDIKGKGGSAAAAAAARRKAAAQHKDEDLSEIWGQVRVAWRRLRTIDKIVLISMLILFVGPFLPWGSSKGKGVVSGIELSGLWTAILAVAAVTVFWLRITLRIGLLVLAQIALVLGACVIPGLMLRGGAEGMQLGGGVYLTLLGGLTAALAALIGAVKA